MAKDQDLKTDVQKVLEYYKLTPTDKWWEQYFSLIRTYQVWPDQKEVRPAPHELKKRLTTLKEYIDKEMKYYKGDEQPDLFEDKYYRGIAEPDLFEDDSDIEYQEFCKNLISLAEDLQIIKNKLEIAISTCPKGRLKKKKRARLQNLIRDLSVLLQEIDPDRIGITYNEYTQEVTGPLFDLTQISAQQLDINVPDNSRSLGKAIQRVIKADSWTTAIKPSGFLKTPQEEKHEQYIDLLNEGWDIRTIADILEESSTTIQRRTDREKNKLFRLFDAGWKISEIAQKRGLNESVAQNWINNEKSKVLKMKKDGRDITDICQKLGHKESLVKKLIAH